MEVHARHTLMGLFVLAVIGAGFAFVYWLEAGGLAERATYRIRFDGSVAGLSRGSAVNFNGVRIGEVTALRLDAAKPGEVVAEIAVEKSAPLRADTRADIDFQGLAGAPTVALSGGSPSLPLLATASPADRMLTADKDAGQGMAQAARTLLRNLDTVVTENAKPLTSAIASIDKFAGALARNSDKVDGILAGLDRLTGGGPKVQPRIFDLKSPTAFPALPSIPQGQMLVPEARALANLETDKIVVDSEAGRVENALWADMLPRLVQSAVVRSLENAGYKRALARAPEGAEVNEQLLLEIRRFHLIPHPTPTAEVVIAARLLKPGGSITEVHVFRATAGAAGTTAEEVTAALNRAFDKVAVELVAWVFGAA
ncbi:MAG: ABC-type transport auxiliary lipoprotein family protein [Hyphomicrobiaceae bacterium]